MANEIHIIKDLKLWPWPYIADDEAEEEEEDEKSSFDKTIMPEAILILEASDEYLRHRVMNLSEAMVW